MDREEMENARIAGPVHGIGLDNEDGHVRITTMENFRLLGGSEETHGQMQEGAIRVNEKLRSQERRVTDLTVRQFVDLAGEVGMLPERPKPDSGSDD